MDILISTLLSSKNLTRTWSCILTLVVFMCIVGEKNVLVQAAVRETKEINFPVRQGAFRGGDGVSDSSNGLHGERGDEVDHTRTPGGQHGEKSLGINPSAGTEGKPNFPIKDVATRDNDDAKVWLEERLDQSQEGEDVGTVGKRPWFQSWSGKRRRAVRSVGNINKRTAERSVKILAFKGFPDNEDKMDTMYERDISKTLDASPLGDSTSAQRLNRERWRLLNDGKISREYLTRYPQQIIKNYDYLNSPRGKETIFGDSKYFSRSPYYYNLPNFQITQDENNVDDGKTFSDNVPSNQKKSAQRVSSESDWSSGHQNRWPHEVAKPKTYQSDFGTHLNTFDDVKFKNSTMREWVARQDGREVLLRAFKSLYSQMSNVPGAPKKSSVKRPINKVDSEDAGRSLEPKGSKPRAYWTHKKRPAFHSWGGKKRSAASELSSLPALGYKQYGQPSKERVVFKVIPPRSKRSTLSFKLNRNQGRANPQSSSAQFEIEETNHGHKLNSVGSFKSNKDLNEGESDVIASISGSLPALPKNQRNALKNNSESITGESTANGPVIRVDPVRTIRSSSKNYPISQRPLTHQHEGRRPPFDSLSIKRGKRESQDVLDDVTHADLPPGIRYLNELQQNDEGDSASKEITPLGTNEIPAESEAPFPKFMFPFTEMSEKLVENGPQWLKQPSLGTLWEKSDILEDIDKRPSFHSWSGKRNNIGEIEKRPSFSSWSGKRNNFGDISKRPSFHSWLGKRDNVGEIEKRPSFHSWSGKRDGLRDLEKRPSFHSWSGKRDSNGELERRPSFHSWSGKRDGLGELEKRPSFHSWSGKRDGLGELEKRPSFHSWSGKRNSAGEIEKRPSFHSWSGKRSISEDQESAASSDLITWNEVSNLWKSLPLMEETRADTSFHDDNSEDIYKLSPLKLYPESSASEQEDHET